MSSTSSAVDTSDVVITAEQLRDQLHSGRPVVILEVRREPSDEEESSESRLPGAQLVTLTTELVGPRTADSGDFPLPTEDQIQDAVRRWGIDDDTLVVVYSREAPALASRAWWTLRWAGVPDVRYLDGGLPAWIAIGGEVSSEVPAIRKGSFTVAPGSLPVLSTEAAGALARSGVLLDARDDARYSGHPEGGHIPGARSLPASRNLGADGLLKSEEELRTAYEAAGLNEQAQWGAYCGGGTAATLNVLALARLGITAALYPGSFSAWSSDPSRPVAKGNEPG
ncbi:sulfurtransferase [Acrocarpospora catenulata]|uniref:sulfurtransferase n=1 Tax=Acrocarpospora catenulata TaxID=2836182 RepID=UPI001BDAEDEA|nr:sulfurtransferase [Acrocarpospora catenulata]